MDVTSMQRISLDEAFTKPTDAIQIEQSVLSVGKHQGLYHSLFSPLHYENNYAYPLLVWLHGPGDSERQLQRIMPQISLRNFAAIAPRAAGDWAQTPGGIEAAQRSVFDCIAIAQRKFNIAPKRIFIGGYANGGTMALRVALSHPQQFAGAMSVAGPFPQGHSPLHQLDDARRLPMLIAQGRNAEKYTVDTTCDELRLFHAAGMSVTLRQYPAGDELTPGMLSDLNVWMMEQVTGVELFSEHDSGDTEESLN